MASGSGDPPPPPPPSQKVGDVITAFRPAKKFKPPNARTSVTSLDFDDTGDLAVVARDDETLQIYNTTLGKHAKEFKSQKYGVHLARFSHHAQNIIYASTKVDDTIRFFSTHDNSFTRYFKGHTDTVTSIALCPSNDTFISCAKDNTVRLWDLQSPNFQGMLNLHGAYLACYDPSATVIAIASQLTHVVLLYDVRNYDKIPFATFDLAEMQRAYLGPNGGDWSKIEFTNDGKNLIVSTTGSGHFVLDAFEGKLKHFCFRKRGDTGRLAPGAFPSTHGANAASEAAAALGQGDTCATPDGQYLIGGSGEEGLLIWDLSRESGLDKDKYMNAEHLTGPSKAAIVGYNPKFNMLATADKDLILWQPDLDIMM
ncbi:WD repeat-containing protein-like protein [Bimuria novae-zelandiae CBS 107.79]|uniref:WD repeat-containing protein-like protein n=1 Tax=Bimuria novae-zelandiae CBS 107.79 TaxID=1447943 RepID=A0A6A5ULQ8_9PLEO|nr:WD repeat-containing protein-like protein [Bimuria novae-zelandiae CBS 107.79]